MSRTQRTPVAVSLALAAALLGSAARAQTAPVAPAASDLEEPEYPPPSARWKVVVAGLGTTAAFYGAAVASSYIFTDTPGVNQLRTPIVGPWLAIGNGGCPAGDDCSTALAVVRIVLTTLDGAAQAGGLAVALEGMFMPTQEWIAPRAPAGAPASPKAPAPTTPSPSTPSPSNGDKNLFFLPMPMTVGSGGVGVGVVGRF
jgi:hypothetical protein